MAFPCASAWEGELTSNASYYCSKEDVTYDGDQCVQVPLHKKGSSEWEDLSCSRACISCPTYVPLQARPT